METNLTIKSWAEDDRPREKMLMRGKNSLTDAELIAIILGSGTSSKSALMLAQEVLYHCGHNLNQLSSRSIQELQHYKGIGNAKAIALTAALELGKRRHLETPELKPKITSPRVAFNLLRIHFEDLTHEEFYAMYLNKANRVIEIRRISVGGISGTMADGKVIFKEALRLSASGIILAHNHPSGQITPSISDKKLTRQLSECGKYIDLFILDHLIIHNHEFFSFADNGLLE